MSELEYHMDPSTHWQSLIINFRFALDIDLSRTSLVATTARPSSCGFSFWIALLWKTLMPMIEFGRMRPQASGHV
jgi:hypothetical protein